MSIMFKYNNNNFFLRFNIIFNKSKYSKNRQLSRVIFYFSIYINIFIIFYIFYIIYGLSLSFSWFWWVTFFIYLFFIIGIFLKIK